jgi:hypothetical protein
MAKTPRNRPPRDIGIQEIIDEYNPNKHKESYVEHIGHRVAERMRMYKWLTWTKFPDIFDNLRSDADLHQALDNWNGWLKETGLGINVKSNGKTHDMGIETVVTEETEKLTTDELMDILARDIDEIDEIDFDEDEQ